MYDTIYRVKKLDQRIEKKGRVFCLVNRCEKVAIYAVYDEGKFMGYEVIKIKILEAKKIIEGIERRNRKKYEGELLNFEKIEKYPRDEDFGYSAWFYMPDEKEMAIKKYDKLTDSKNDNAR